MLNLDLITPEKIISSQQVHMVVIPGEDGVFGVLEQHAPLISAVKAGVVDVYDKNLNDVSSRVFITGGIAEVNAQGCSIMANEAFNIDADSKEIALRRLAKAEHSLEYAISEQEKSDAENDVSIFKELVELY